ncbi:MAG: DNA polymerase I [Bdellovibrionales bacterium]|nr:DNA polymerase I [Bdellovibrionales bacterium]
MKKLFLVDVSSFFFRAFFAIPPLTNKDGLPTNALYGFMNMVVKLLRDIKPDYIAFCFDRKERSFRHEIYPEYKANRAEMPEDLVPQVPYLKKLTDVLGIPRFDKEGYEADDVIGSLATYGRKNKLEVVIVSGDKDFAQLVDNFTIMYDTMKDKKYNVDGVIEKWGIEPQQMIDYLAMVGDSSDNIPGVKGIGPKGAQKLLAEFKTLDNIYKNIDKISGKSTVKKLVENKEMAYKSKELVKIVSDLDLDIGLEDLKLKSIKKEDLHKLFTELNFKSFERTLIGTSNDAKPSSENKSEKNSTNKKNNINSNFEEKTATVFDLDKDIDPYSEVVCLKGERGLYLLTSKNLWVLPINKEVGKVLGKKKLKWRGFDLKTVWRDLHLTPSITPMMDLMLAAYVASSTAMDTFDNCHEQFLGKKIPDLAGGKELFDCYNELEPYILDRLEEVGGKKVLNEIELPLVPVLHDMESKGVALDLAELKKQSQSLEKEIKNLEIEIHKLAGESFNISSPKQLGHILFEKLKLPVIKKTKTGFSTNAEVLEKLVDQHPICGRVIEYREYTKLKSTYVDALPELVNSEDHRIHTTFRQATTTTGRLSSVNPNLQNIPIRTERGRKIRSAFIASNENVLLSIDYSQIELRILAHITEDPALCRAFANDLDIHAATASEIFGIELNEVDAEMRRKAKAVNFGIAYGQGVFGLSESLKIPRGEAKEIIENYFKKFKNVKDYMETTIEKAKKDGYVTTIYGRKRFLRDINSKNGALRSFAERAAINAPIQGTASDLMKKAMIAVHESIDCQMLLQVHDELLFEVSEEEVVDLAKEIKEILENVDQLKVPLKANIAWGKNWEDAHA